MSFSRYAIEKKQVSLDMGVTWQDATPIETRNGRLLGTYSTLLECEDKNCDLEEYRYELEEVEKPDTYCGVKIPYGYAETITFTSGIIVCGIKPIGGSGCEVTTDSSHALRYPIYQYDSEQGYTVAIGTVHTQNLGDYCTFQKEYFVVDLHGDALEGLTEPNCCNCCNETTCFNVNKYMPWVGEKIKRVFKKHYKRDHCSEEWYLDEEYVPIDMGFGERWVKTYEDMYKETWQHQIVTDILSDNKVVWENEGEPFDYEYEVSIPQDVQLIEYLRADGIAANASVSTDNYGMKLMIDPINLGIPSGNFGCNPKQCWKWNGNDPYYINPNNITIQPNTWKYVNFDKIASLFSSSGYTNVLDNTYVGGVIPLNEGNTYFPYKVPSSNGFEDEYLNSSEYGFINREGNKIAVEYIFGQYTNTSGVRQNFYGNASKTMSVPSDAVDVVFNDHVESLPVFAFKGNTTLTSVTFNRVSSIGQAAFTECTNLQSVAFNHPNTFLGTDAFSYSGLRSVDLSNVSRLGDEVFDKCTSLTGITFGNSLTYVGNVMFRLCTSLTDIVIPSNISKIRDGAFYLCNSITSVTFEEGGNYTIYGSAFSGCNIKILTMRTTTPPVVKGFKPTETFTFASNCLIYVPCQSVDAYKVSVYWRGVSSMIHPIPNEYRWVNDGYVCIDGMKYLREKKQGRNASCADDAWYDVGETRVSGGLIKCGYEEIEYIYRDSSHRGFISDLGVTLKDDTKIEIKLRPTSNGGGMIIGEVNSPNDDDDYRFFWYNNRIFYDYGSDRMNSPLAINTDYLLEVGNYYIKNLTTGNYILQGSAKSGVATAHTRTLGLFGEVNDDYAWIYYIKVYEGETLVKDFIPVKFEDGSGTLYDTISKTPCTVSNGTFGAPTE